MKIPTAGMHAIRTNVSDNESVLAISKSLKHNTVINAYNYGTCSMNLKNVLLTCVPSMLQASLYNLEQSTGERTRLTLHVAFLF
jgi:hypothetical protein